MRTEAHDKQLLHVKEAALELGVNPSTIRRRIHSGELAAVRLGEGGRLRVRRHALEQLPSRPQRPVQEPEGGAKHQTERYSVGDLRRSAETPAPIATKIYAKEVEG